MTLFLIILYSLLGSLIPCAIAALILHEKMANSMKELRGDISTLHTEVKKFHTSIVNFEKKLKASKGEKIHVRRKV
jgi:hypothetical protein